MDGLHSSEIYASKMSCYGVAFMHIMAAAVIGCCVFADYTRYLCTLASASMCVYMVDHFKFCSIWLQPRFKNKH